MPLKVVLSKYPPTSDDPKLNNGCDTDPGMQPEWSHHMDNFEGRVTDDTTVYLLDCGGAGRYFVDLIGISRHRESVSMVDLMYRLRAEIASKLTRPRDFDPEELVAMSDLYSACTYVLHIIARGEGPG